jgi:CBS domain-containing protein
MNQLSEILDAKGRGVLRIDADASVLEAVKRMVEHNVGSLLVMDGATVAGIVTERDYLRHVALDGPSLTVREIMTSSLITAAPETRIDECMTLMTERRIRHLPVIEDGEVMGMVSIGDVVKFQLDRREDEVKFLNEYIATG